MDKNILLVSEKRENGIWPLEWSPWCQTLSKANGLCIKEFVFSFSCFLIAYLEYSMHQFFQDLQRTNSVAVTVNNLLQM